MREFVVMWEKSAGNESVGEMWIETAVFPETATLADVASWTWPAYRGVPAKKVYPSDEPDTRDVFGNGRVMIQIAQRPMEDQP